MYTFLITIHILVALVMVGVVLLQSGKGAGLGAGFGGGGANTLFGSSGGSNFFTKLTMVLAGVFMLTSLGLTLVKSRSLRTSIFDQGSPQTQAPAVPGTPSDTVAPAPATPPTAPATNGEAVNKAVSPAGATVPVEKTK
jgi:preprotein translocase subunit SecG